MQSRLNAIKFETLVEMVEIAHSLAQLFYASASQILPVHSVDKVSTTQPLLCSTCQLLIISTVICDCGGEDDIKLGSILCYQSV